MHGHLLWVCVHFTIPLLLLFIVCPANNECTTCFENNSIGLFTTSSLNNQVDRNVQVCVVNRIVYWEEYICPTPASVLFNYGHYTSMIERIVYLPCNHYSCMIDKGSSGTMYLKRRQWFFRKLLHLLRKRRWCKRNFQLMRALSILLLLGGDVELNPGPHQIMLICRCNSLSKLSTVDENILSGLSIPDLLMDYVCHVAVNMSGLSIPDLLMDYVCHVAVNQSGLSIPDLLMDYVCHVAVNQSGLSIPDLVMDCVCHVPLNLSRSSVPNCNMDYVCHGVMPSVRRDIHLADMSILLLLLGGDVELNSGPRQDVVNDTSETTQECNPERQSTNGEKSVDSRLVMLSACQRKHLQNETSAERTSRLARLIGNQRQRLENESEEQRSARLGRLSDSQTRRLVNESEEQRSARLDRLAGNRAQRLENESTDERSKRLSQLSHNRWKRKQNETSEVPKLFIESPVNQGYKIITL